MKIKIKEIGFCYKCYKNLYSNKVQVLTLSGYLCEQCYIDKLRNEGKK